MNPNVAPLKGSFMLTSIVGFIISWAYVLPRSLSWGATFMFFFSLMFISSIISMTHSPYDVDDLLQIDHKRKKK